MHFDTHFDTLFSKLINKTARQTVFSGISNALRLLERDEWDKLPFSAIELRIFLIKTTECRKAKQRIIGVVTIDSYVITENNKIKIDHYEKIHLFSFSHGTARHTVEY